MLRTKQETEEQTFFLEEPLQFGFSSTAHEASLLFSTDFQQHSHPPAASFPVWQKLTSSK